MMRVERINRRKKNTLNQEAVRARTDLPMPSWFPRATKLAIDARLDGFLRSLTVAQIAALRPEEVHLLSWFYQQANGTTNLHLKCPRQSPHSVPPTRIRRRDLDCAIFLASVCEEANEDELVNRNVKLRAHFKVKNVKTRHAYMKEVMKCHTTLGEVNVKPMDVKLGDKSGIQNQWEQWILARW